MRIAALVAYDGTAFAGFQRQATDRTVQGELERVLGALYGQPVTVAGAGRTDAGVHARGQVIAFDGREQPPAERLPQILTGRLPTDVAVRRAWPAEGFDPRRQATARVYRYTLALDRIADPLRDRYATRVAPGLDVAAMQAAAARLVGEHDFGSLCCQNGYDGSTRRTIRRVGWERSEERLVVELEGDSFLYKQVRCIMGVLLEIGRGRYPSELIDALLRGEPRPVQIAVAPPTGLVLERVEYGPARDRRSG
ncbi:MAG: tRNA pseudouridine(38-40) synthase TruA [Armatimonadetes bacterium]|nr:tRNA pseudouridine(38-40) synthase TruA [Armatimonadota bacterium]